MAIERAHVTSTVIRWAREKLGASIDEAAKQVKVPSERISEWEEGKSYPTFAQLRQLANFYRRPTAVFFLPEPPQDFTVPNDFRTIGNRIYREGWSRKLFKIYQRSCEIQETTMELYDLTDEEPRFSIPSITLDAAPERTANEARQSLGITIDQQLRWRSPDIAFKGWRASIENLGCFVLMTSEVEPEEVRGFSLSEGFPPVIMVNALEHPNAQIFTLLHELAHLMLRKGGLCNLNLSDRDGRNIELFCNKISGAILLPREVFQRDELVLSHNTGELWVDAVIQDIAKRYKVSPEAVVLRLVNLDMASWDFYIQKKDEYRQNAKDARSAKRLQNRHKNIIIPPARMVLRDRGKPYVRLVMNAYHEDLITASSVARLLGLKLKHLVSIEREM